MKICILASGSGGNSIYIESHETALIIDQGISHKELMNRMSSRGLNKDKIKGILVTHEHGDHINGVGVTSRELGVPIYVTSGSLDKMEKVLRGDEQVITIEGGVTFKIGPIEIQPFSVSHDALDPVQFCIMSGRKKIAIATDLGFVSTLVAQRIKGSNLIVIEANYDTEMLKKSSYPWEIKQRINGRKGHLSNRNAADIIFNITKNGTPMVVLAHLSEENNRSDLAEKAVQELFEKYGKEPGFLLTASQNEPTQILEI